VISSMEAPTRPAGMSKADADIILAIHHLKSNPQFPVDCRHVYGHQDEKNRKKQENQDKELEEDNEGFNNETEAESRKSKAETETTNMFQIGERKREPKGPQEVKQKEMPDLGEEGGTTKKKLVDEAMKNIVCDDIVTNTTETALRGGIHHRDQ
jgi:hypothetical protein